MNEYIYLLFSLILFLKIINNKINQNIITEVHFKITFWKLEYNIIKLFFLKVDGNMNLSPHQFSFDVRF
jgi:hypothetical protein